MALVKAPAKCGCEGCILESEGCEIDAYIEKNGLPLPPKEAWPCIDENGTYIFKRKENANE